MPEPRMTLSTQAVLRALLDNPEEPRYGLEISASAGLPSGTLYPILARLEKLGWVESRWEEIDPKAEGRPRRRYYRLSADGVVQARSAMVQAAAARAKLGLRLRPVAES